MTVLAVTELTESKVEGTGVFDLMMKATKAHLEQEYKQNRIKGAEYATVYLGSLDSTMNAAMQFLLQGRKVGIEEQILEQQLLIAKVAVQKAQIELEILELSKQKVDAEVAQLHAQTELTTQQTLNAVIEGTVLTAQKCKLDAEYDYTLAQTIKSATENSLLAQKVVTEKAQTMSLGVDDDSVIGRQKSLYEAQTNGFQRDAEQKVTKILTDTWNARRMTDEGTVADGVNHLDDATLGRAVLKMLAGINA